MIDKETKDLIPVVTRLVLALFVGILLVALLIPMPARGAPAPTLVFEDPTGTVRLFDKACTHNAVRDAIPPAVRAYMKAAEGDFQIAHGPNQFLNGCWREFAAGEVGHDEAVVVTLWEDRDELTFKRSLFRVEGL